MTPKLFRVLLPVNDIEQAVRFYQTVLGIEGVRVSKGRHYFDLDGTILACFDPRADGDDYDADPNPEHIYIAVEDIEKTLAACKSADAKFSGGDIDGGDPAGAIATRPWSERSFYIKDPSGNPICFVDRATMFTGK